MQFGGLNSVSRICQLIRWLPVCFFLYFLAVPRPLCAAQTGATNNATDAERNAQIQLQLINDAQRTANYKAQLTLLPERARRGEISQQRLPADLQLAQAAVTGEQQKYDALGGDWGHRFSQELQDDAQKIIDGTHLTLRLNDQQTPLGIDAHRAALDAIDIDRYTVYREQGAVTIQDGQLAEAVKARLDALNAKYARSPQGADYRDRVAHLVQQGESEAQKEQWVAKAQQYNATHKTNPVASIFGSIFASISAYISNSLSSVLALVHGGPVTSRTQSHSTNPVSVALLVLLLLGGAGYYFLQRSSQKPATISYADLNALSAALPPAESPATPTATPPAPKAPSAPLPPGALKERLFAEERQKYQARYNDVQDQLTAATAELGRLGKVISGIQDNLKLLGKSVQSRVHGMAVSHYSSFANLARSAVLGKPVVRLLKRAGGLLKIVILIGVGGFVLVAANLALNQDWIDLAVMLAGAFAVLFFIERYLQLRAPLVVFRRDGDKFKQLSLAYVSDDQAPLPSGAPGYRTMRVLAESKTSPTEEPLVSANSWGAAMRPESFLLYLESMAVYRLDASGAFAPLFANNASELIQNYGRWITEALNEQKSFAAANLAPLATYAKVALRRRRAAEELPGLEKVVHSVDRLESIWRDVYVSDKVIDLLLHRIDMFKMGYKATPPGILLYGYAGNGKAYLAKKIAESISARLEAIPATLNSPKDVKEIWERCRGKDPVVLFVDYAERVFPKFGSKNVGTGTRESTWPGWANGPSSSPSRATSG
jgi:ATPase family associated with various cellular activities (AAA)